MKDVVCPNNNYHFGTERVRNDPESWTEYIYECDCGCKFEYYGGDSFVVQDGHKLKPLAPKEFQYNPWPGYFIDICTIIVVLGLGVFLASILVAVFCGG
jgi:hypothetical protein